MTVNKGSLVSGRVPVTDYANLTADRYQFLGLTQAEPNLGPGADNSVLVITTNNTRSWANSLTLTGNVSADYFIGNGSLLTGIFTTITNQTFQGDGTTVAFTLQQTATAVSILVTVNGITQTPDVDYLVITNILTFTTAPANADVIQVRFLSNNAVSGTYSNADVAAFLPTYTGNISAGNVLTSAQVIANGEIQSGTGFFTGGYLSVNGNTDLHDTTVTGNISATGNIEGQYILGNGAFLTGIAGGATDWANIGNINNANGPTSITIGQNAGINQGNSAIAIGVSAANNISGGSQSDCAIAIGQNSGGPGGFGLQLASVVYQSYNSAYVAVGTGYSVGTSTDGYLWELNGAVGGGNDPNTQLSAVIVNAGATDAVIGVGYSYNPSTNTSSSLIYPNINHNNTPAANVFPAELLSIAWSGTKYAAVGGDDLGNVFIATTTQNQGTTDWTQQTADYNGCLFGIVWGSTQFVAVGIDTSSGPFNSTALILTSPDGAAWTQQAAGVYPANNFSGIAWNGTDQFVAVGRKGSPTYGSLILTSPDGVTWTEQAAGIVAYGQFNAVTWTGTQYIAVGYDGTYSLIYTSPDGVTWAQQAPGQYNYQLTSVTYNGTNQYVAVGSDGNLSAVLFSGDASGWQTGGLVGQGYASIAMGQLAGNKTQSQTAIAIGQAAGQNSQGSAALAVGNGAGQNSQGNSAVAIGDNAGYLTQGASSVAIGSGAGNDTQGNSAVAVGDGAGADHQGQWAVAVGAFAGLTTQGANSVGIGVNAGGYQQGTNAVAIGSGAGTAFQANNSIILNASSTSLEQTTANTFTVKPIRNATGSNALYYDAGSGEITYDTPSAVLASSIANGASSVGIPTNSGNVTIAANSSSTWTFDTTGNLTFPSGNLVITPDYAAFSNAAVVSSVNNLITLSTGVTGGTSSLWVEDYANIGTSNIAAVYANPVPGSGNVRIAVGTNGGAGPNLWDFEPNGNLSAPGNVSAVGNVTGAYLFGNGSQLTGVTASVPSQTILPTIQSIVISNTSSEYETSGGSGYANVLVANVAPVIEYGVIVTAGSTVDKYVTGNLANIPGTEQITISTGTSDQPFTVYAYVTTNAGTYYSGPEVGFSGLCLLKGTMISLADGTYKPIEDINNDDLLLTWDFDLGRYAQSQPLWIKRGETGTRYNQLTFSDGTILRTFDQHRIFNKQAGAFTYPMSDDTPVGTITVNEHGQEITLVKRDLVWDTIEHYNIITNYHINLFADSVLTSCRFNNIYPITDMKFVKSVVLNRNLSEFAEIESRFVSGLRLQEQSFELAMIEGYVNRLLATEAMELIGV